MPVIEQIQDIRVALIRFEGELQLEIDDMLAKARADARRAALEACIAMLRTEATKWKEGDVVEALTLVGCQVRALLDDAGRGT